MMLLHTDQGNFQSIKLIIADNLTSKKIHLKYCGHDSHVVPYLVKNKLPVLELDSGEFIFSPNAATRLLLGNQLTTTDEIQVKNWLEWESGKLQPTLLPALQSVIGHGKAKDDHMAALKASLQELDEKLKGSQYLVGNDITAADICIWASLTLLFTGNPPLSALTTCHLNLCKWFSKLQDNQAFSHSLQQIQDIKEVKASLLAQSAPASDSVSTTQLLEKGTVAVEATVPTTTSQSTESSQPSVTSEEVGAAKNAWLTGKEKLKPPRKLKKPLSPIEGEQNVLITSALPYVNNVPHLGNIIGCVLSADVFARFCRLRNINTLYICGTDEYGTATETKALEEGLTPQQICDKYNKLHAEIYEWFNIGFDYFGRTTTKEQTEIAQDMFWKLHDKGYIIKDSVDQLKCQQCNRFLADRFVEGTCPLCAYEDARGDQCDKCGKLINAIDLINPRCKICSNTPIVKTSQHLFLDLNKLEPMLSKHLDVQFENGLWSNNAKVITKSWIRDGLKARCISRDLKWGTPVPLEGYTDKVFYVWYDAPIGYISITANYTDEWQKWWKNPEQVTLYNFLGKDNVPFHSVIFPSCQLGCDDNYTIVNNLSATEYLNYEDGKFSKSRGVGIFGSDAKETGIPADIWRFYLLFLRPESQDSSFSWDDFVTKNNSELLNNLGNFINRALMFVNNMFNGILPEMQLIDSDLEILALINREIQNYVENLTKIKIRDGIRNILSISKLGNQYIQANKPWVLVKGSTEERIRAGTVIGIATNISCLLSTLVQPYMPDVSSTIRAQLNAPADANVVPDQFVCFLPQGHKIGKPAPLFQKIDSCKIEELRKKFVGNSPAAKKEEKAKKSGGDQKAALASPEEIDRLTQDVARQGERVRQLKSAKAEKSQVDQEVAKLLELKKKLSLAQGVDPASSGGKGGKDKKGGATQTVNNTKKTPAAMAAASPAEVDRLTKDIAEQGDKVRQLKTNKAEKAQVDKEVAILLDLKKQLVLAQGVDPATASGGGKKKKGKK